MNYFSEGQKVICLNNKSRSGILPIEPGKIYTILSIYKCPCGADQLILAETFYEIIMNCKCGLSVYRYRSYYQWRFRPIVAF